MAELKPVVFLDRDGTINYDAGYINDIDNFVMYPYAAQAIRMLNINGFLVVVITNQSGLARGFFTEETLSEIHNKMLHDLKKQGALIDAVYFCPHDPNAKLEKYKAVCSCRKPETGLIDMALKDLQIDKSRMYFIGDKHSDIMAGYKSGCKTIMVKTGYGKGDLINKSHKWEVKPDKIADTLLDGIKLILKKQI